MLRNRVEVIKEALKEVKMSQGAVSRELGVTSHAVNFWIHGKMPSKNIKEWFRNKFGDGFIEKLEKL